MTSRSVIGGGAVYPVFGVVVHLLARPADFTTFSPRTDPVPVPLPLSARQQAADDDGFYLQPSTNQNRDRGLGIPEKNVRVLDGEIFAG
jgi:hypothetical protein